MLVVIFHPTEELKFIELQKELISIVNDENNEDAQIWYANTPLWIELPQSLEAPSNLSNCNNDEKIKQALKTVSDKITDISFKGFAFSPKELKIDFSVAFDNEDISVQLPFITQYTDFPLSPEKQDDLLRFFMNVQMPQIKIFRLAKKISPEEPGLKATLSQTSDFVWKKLK